ncbi:hypothetical protein E1A91_D13G141200v1, partial [Gossypium mustelinum]
ATPVSTLPTEAQAPTGREDTTSYLECFAYQLKPLPEFLNNWIVIESPCKNGRIDKKYRHKDRNITLRSLHEVKRYETDGILPVRGKNKKDSNEKSESSAPLLVSITEASTKVRTNSENMHMCNLTVSALTAPKGRRGRKRKMKTLNDEVAPIDAAINDEAAPIDVPLNDKAALIDVPINDEATLIDVSIIDEAALIDVPITYVENFSDLGR